MPRSALSAGDRSEHGSIGSAVAAVASVAAIRVANTLRIMVGASEVAREKIVGYSGTTAYPTGVTINPTRDVAPHSRGNAHCLEVRRQLHKQLNSIPSP